MKYLLLLPVMLLTGCLWQSVDNNDIQTAIGICGGVDKVVHIDANFAGNETVMCSDRRTVYMTSRTAEK